MTLQPEDREFVVTVTVLLLLLLLAAVILTLAISHLT
jgi:hypothetical protein